MYGFLFILTLSFHPTPSVDGTLLEKIPYTFPFETHEAWLEKMNGRGLPDWGVIFDKPTFERYRSNAPVAGHKITYASGGLKINGFLFVPTDRKGPLPAVIYNRGGAGEWARITFWEIMELYRLADQGYVVVASFLRGVGGSEGQPELGGGDIQDTLSLIPLLENMKEVDSSRIGMWGFSRGVTTTFMTLAKTDRIKTAVVCAGSGNAVDSHRRAEFEEHVYPKVLKGFAEDKEKALRSISAMYWAEKFPPKTSILFLHGDKDKRVLASDSQKMAEKLASLGRPHRIQIFEGATHSMIERFLDVRKEIDTWLQHYLVEGS